MTCFRSPFWQNMVDIITICGAGFKAPTKDELKGPLLTQKVVDVKAQLEEQHVQWRRIGCTIMIDGWTDRRNRTLLNFLVSSGGNCTYLNTLIFEFDLVINNLIRLIYVFNLLNNWFAYFFR